MVERFQKVFDLDRADCAKDVDVDKNKIMQNLLLDTPASQNRARAPRVFYRY